VRLRDAIIDKTEGWLACGPCVVTAITGAPLTTVEAVFRMNGSDGVSTKALDVANALAAFGLGLTLGYMAEYGEAQPLWWVLRFCPDDKPLIIAIEQEGGSHWIATHGWWLSDAQTYGRWIEWDDWGLHADASVSMVRLVEPG
jgi:hypothetical protein